MWQDRHLERAFFWHVSHPSVVRFYLRLWGSLDDLTGQQVGDDGLFFVHLDADFDWLVVEVLHNHGFIVIEEETHLGWRIEVCTFLRSTGSE